MKRLCQFKDRSPDIHPGALNLAARPLPRGKRDRQKKSNDKNKNNSTNISLKYRSQNNFKARGQDYASALSSRVDHWGSSRGCPIWF